MVILKLLKNFLFYFGQIFNSKNVKEFPVLKIFCISLKNICFLGWINTFNDMAESVNQYLLSKSLYVWKYFITS